MLTPLKERTVQESDGGASSGVQPAKATTKFRSPAEETEDLRRALRESRHRLRRSAWESTRQIAALNNEVSRLSELCANYRQQLARFESGVAIVELGCKLMQLSAERDELEATVHQVWTLERTLEAAHAEYARLAQERNELAQELYESRH